MIRTIAAAALTAALVVSVAAPASAEPQPPTSPRTPVVGVIGAPAVPPCVTTIWRAAYTGQPKTARGRICYGLPSMWIPSAWPVVDRVWARGQFRPVYERPLHG